MMRRFLNERFMVWLLLLALVSLQTLAVMHRIVHKESLVPRVVQTSQGLSVVHQSPDNSAHATSRTISLFSGLWGEHKSLTDCQLFDQACPDALHHTVHMDLYIVPPAIGLGEIFLERFALFERFYAARGPPVRVLI